MSCCLEPRGSRVGFKVTNTHLYFMERALEREGESRPIYEILRSQANSLGLTDFIPWDRWKKSSMPSWIIRQPATRRSHLYARPVVSCRSRCPKSPMQIASSNRHPGKSNSTRRRRANLGYHHCQCTRSTKVPSIRWH